MTNETVKMCQRCCQTFKEVDSYIDFKFFGEPKAERVHMCLGCWMEIKRYAIENTRAPKPEPCKTCKGSKFAMVPHADNSKGGMLAMCLVPCPDCQKPAEPWEEFCKQEMRNKEYYVGLIDRIAKVFGEAAYISDDGSIQQEPLRAKIPELVEKMRADLDQCNKDFYYQQKKASNEWAERLRLEARVRELEGEK